MSKKVSRITALAACIILLVVGAFLLSAAHKEYYLLQTDSLREVDAKIVGVKLVEPMLARRYLRVQYEYEVSGEVHNSSDSFRYLNRINALNDQQELKKINSVKAFYHVDKPSLSTLEPAAGISDYTLMLLCVLGGVAGVFFSVMIFRKYLLGSHVNWLR